LAPIAAPADDHHRPRRVQDAALAGRHHPGERYVDRPFDPAGLPFVWLPDVEDLEFLAPVVDASQVVHPYLHYGPARGGSGSGVPFEHSSSARMAGGPGCYRRPAWPISTSRRGDRRPRGIRSRASVVPPAPSAAWPSTSAH